MPSTGRFRYLDVAAKPGPDGRAAGTLVLIHGFPFAARMWEPQLSLAGLGWRIIAPELRGFNGGTVDRPVSSMDDYAADVVDLLDALHVEDAVIGGLSMGGYVMFAMLRHAARYFRGVVLADTRPQADTPEGVEGRRKMIALVREKGAGAVADAMLPKLIGETSMRTQPAVADEVRAMILTNSPDAIAGGLTALMTRPDSTSALATIHVPALIVVGEEDVITPPEVSRQMHQAIGGSELVTIPGAGHVSNLEQPAVFNAALARFLTYRV